MMRCPACSYEATDINSAEFTTTAILDLRSHYSAFHLAYAPYWCQYCDEGYSSSEKLLFHIGRSHPQCALRSNCEPDIRKEIILDEVLQSCISPTHDVASQGDNKWEIQKNCDLNESSISRTVEETDLHIPSASSRKRRRSSRSHRPTDSPQVYKCIECGIEYKTDGGLRRHKERMPNSCANHKRREVMRPHWAPRRDMPDPDLHGKIISAAAFVCEVCALSFEKADGLRRHRGRPGACRPTDRRQSVGDSNIDLASAPVISAIEYDSVNITDEEDNWNVKQKSEETHVEGVTTISPDSSLQSPYAKSIENPNGLLP